MGKWPKPAEGSWTEHYPELGTGPISFRDSTSPEFYELEREAIFKRAWLNVGRVEELPRVGSYFTKEIHAAKTSVIVVKGKDQKVRAFYNVCRHRGNKLVWNDFPNEEVKGACRQFTCKYHGWRYDLEGALTFVQQPHEFFDLDTAQYGLRPVHCDVWNGFIFINLDPEPRQSLRDFLGPMITALDDYPFEMMTERYDFDAHNNSNWKIFADAFQEYYHVPSLHSQQVPSEVRQPNADVRVRTLPDRRTAPAGLHCRNPALAARAGIHVPGRTGHAQRPGGAVADTGDAPVSRAEPRRHRAVGHHQLPDLPESGDPDLPRVVPAVPVLADVAQHPQVRGVQRVPSRDARCGSASSTRSPRWCSRSSRCRTPACSAAPRRPWSTTSSTTSRSTTRRSSSGTCTRWPSTGSRTTSDERRPVGV